MKDSDVKKVKEFFIKKKVGSHVIEHGIRYLIDGWKKFVIERENDEYYEPEEYLNELDGRDILQDVIEKFSDEDFAEEVRDEIAPYDEKFRKLLENTNLCAWGKGNEKKYIPTKKVRFWYWGWAKSKYHKKALSSGYQPRPSYS